jgi:L-arabinose isomerase
VTDHSPNGPSGRANWFVTGSQHLYGDETLRVVDGHAREIADAIPVRIEDRGDRIAVEW